MTKQYEKKSLEEKVKEEMPEFFEETQSLTVDQLESRLAQAAKDAEAIQDAKEADVELGDAQVRANELATPYREGKKAVRLRSRYLIKLIKDKGGK